MRLHFECYSLFVQPLYGLIRRLDANANAVLGKMPGARMLLLTVDDSNLESDQAVVFPPPV